MTCRVVRAVALFGIVALAASCGGGDDDSTAAPATSNVDGAALYAANCASCHGTDLRGTDKGPSHLSQVYESSHHSDDAFRNAVATGSTAHHWDFGDMPPVPGLGDDEVEAIIAYVRDVQDREGFETYPPE